MASETTPLVHVTAPMVLPTTTNGDHHTNAAAAASQKTLTTLLGFIQMVLLILFLTCTKITDEAYFSSSEYIIFRDIMVMLLLGFGYLMTFLSKYGLGAVG
jgi:cytochrome bd-type quinol oxidase subunit 2